jgi:outer membrane receptor for ferrienterochelin and colicins
VDITLRNQKQRNDWDFAVKVLNLFNADAREPSPSPGLIPYDLPLAGREWRIELSHQI